MLAQEIVAIFWRKLTPVDFFNIERASTAGPTSGGGQLYIDVPLGRGVSPDEFGEFFNGTPLGEQSSEWQPIEIDVHSGYEPEVVASLTIAPRQGGNRRYRIANQNRQRPNSARHPAWSAEQGFPAAPDDVSSRADSRMPNLDYLKVCIGRTEIREYYAFYTNTGNIPAGWPKDIGLDNLFRPNQELEADGILEIGGGLRVSNIAALLGTAFDLGEQPITEPSRFAAVVRRSLTQRVATERSSSEPGATPSVRTETSEAVSINSPRSIEAENWVEERLQSNVDWHSVVRYGHTNLESVPLGDGLLPGADFSLHAQSGGSVGKYIEVKSAQGSFPRTVRLTAAELRRARKCAEDGTPYEIWIVVFEEDRIELVIVPAFQHRAAQLIIEDVVGIEVELERS